MSKLKDKLQQLKPRYEPSRYDWLHGNAFKEYKEAILIRRSSSMLNEFLQELGYPEPWPSVYTIEDILFTDGNIEITFNDDPKPEYIEPEPRREDIGGHRVQFPKHKKGGLPTNIYSNTAVGYTNRTFKLHTTGDGAFSPEAYQELVDNIAQLQGGSSDPFSSDEDVTF